MEDISPFQSEELHEICLYLYKDAKGKVQVKGDTEGLKEGEYIKHSVWFKIPNYKDSTCILSGVYKSSSDLNNIDPVEASMLTVLRLVKKWTFKDFPCTEENIQKLNPSIGGFIANQISKITSED